MSEIPQEKVFYLDESGFDHRAVSDSGWSPKGQRLPAKKKGSRGSVKRYSIVALRNLRHKICLPMAYEGTMTRELFSMYLERTLRVLPPQSILVLDNASCHTHLNLSSVLLETGSTLMDLPPYSPELNPIEKLWANVKQKLKTIYRYLTEDFFQAICLSLQAYADENFSGSYGIGLAIPVRLTRSISFRGYHLWRSTRGSSITPMEISNASATSLYPFFSKSL